MATQPTIQIDKGIPAPNRQGGTGNARFPLAQMDVGDSFHVPWGADALKTRSVISSSVTAFKLRNPGTNFRTAKDDAGVRVWRIA